MPTLGATHFNTRDYQIQRKNHFEIQFDSSVIDDNISLVVVSFSLPNEETDIIEAPYFNQQVKLAGFTKFSDGTLVIRDAIVWDTEKKFREWRKMVYDAETAKMGYAADYKKNAYVKEYSPNGETYREWKLIGCWPSSVEYGELTYEDGGEKQITATITYDYAYRTDVSASLTAMQNK